MAQEDTFWPSGVMRFGPHWRNSKIRRANIVHVMLDVGT